MEQSHDPLRAEFFQGWENYQNLLITALAPLSLDQLALRAAPELRSVGLLATHIVGARANWMHRAFGEGGSDIVALTRWRGPEDPPHTADELVQGLRSTWSLIQDCLARWTPADYAQTFTREWQGNEYVRTHGWVIWHLLEHDLHHGGEISLILGMHSLIAVDI